MKELFQVTIPILLVSLILSSCISNKRSVYLQDKTQRRSHDALVDHKFEDPFQPIVLETGDVLSVRISYYELTKSGEANLNEDDAASRAIQHPYLNGYRVDDSLNVTLPVIGTIKVGGLSIDQAEAEINKAAGRFYSSPTTKIFLMNFRVTVLGEVGKPGTYDVYNNKITVFEALGLAQDAGPFANREAVRITRSRGGQNHLYHIDLTDENLLASNQLYLQPNDIVMVKAQKRKKYTLNDSQGVVRALSIFISIGGVVIALTNKK